VIVGPNGAGKSTLLSAILGQAPFTGSITANWSGTGRIGFVPQTLAVDRSLPVTVTDFLALARQRRPICFGIARITRERIASLLAQVGLEHLAERQLSVLSGGELRRVLLTNAIDPTPELLLLDEPSAGLDQTACEEMETMIRALNREQGVTVLMVSHDLEQVRRLADRVTLLNRSVQRDGPPAAVLTADLAEMLLSGRQPSEPRR
jgi:zinc transport system ATP-binding protein